MTLEEARAKAREIISLVEDKRRDPRLDERMALQAQQRSGHTFEGLFADWLHGYAKLNLRSWEQARDKLFKHALPLLGDMRLADIKAHHINQVLDRLMQGGKGVQANRVRAHLSAVFNWGLGRDYGLEYNPVAVTMRPKKRELPRSVVYQHADMRALWRAVVEQSGGFSRAVGLVWQLALVTGQRKGEIVGALMSELDLSDERPVWKLPKERNKGAREHLVPLSPLAVDLFKQAIQMGPVPRTFVFPSASGGHLAPHSVSQALARSRGRVGLERNQTVHDLRRTMSSELARLGVPVDVRARILNHAKRGVTESVYNTWTYERPMRDAMNKWSVELLKIVDAQTKCNLTQGCEELVSRAAEAAEAA